MCTTYVVVAWRAQQHVAYGMMVTTPWLLVYDTKALWGDTLAAWVAYTQGKVK